MIAWELNGPRWLSVLYASGPLLVLGARRKS